MTDEDLSLWGWGYASEHPDEEERRRLGEMAETYLGFPERPLLDTPTFEDATLSDSGVEPPFEFCTTDDEVRARHTYGKGYRDLIRGFRGDFSPAPDAVACPKGEEDIVELLNWAASENIAIVPFGGGTSVVGGIECRGSGYAGVVSLDTRALDEVVEVDEVSRSARIRAGATGPRLQEQLDEHGLQLRHYPQSYEFSTLGGWLATHAGGHFATVYTHIDDFVESLRMVTPSGIVNTRRLPRSGAGPDPNALLLGSEGSFGVFTEAWMRVQPRPEYRAKSTVAFDDFHDGVRATRAIAQARLYPANCRLLDRNEAVLNQVASANILVLGFESTDSPVDDSLERAVRIAEEHGGDVREKTVGDGSEEHGGAEGDWRDSFFEAPYLFNGLVSVGVLVDTFETSVTWEDFDALHDAVRSEVVGTAEEVCGDGFLSCRFTHVYEDGPAPYYTILAPADVGNELSQWREIKKTASEVLDEHGAATTHHHAVGRVHRDAYERETPDAYRDALRAAKDVFDPAGIMNPGALLSSQG
ncbi:MAG: FAD-binding oxidoreductase [Halobacteriales archaeon]